MFQITDIMSKARFNIPRRLFHVHMFSNGPLASHIKEENNKNSSSLNNMTKSVNVIKARYLSITFGNEFCLEALDRAIMKIFGVKHLFGTHNNGVRGSRN